MASKMTFDLDDKSLRKFRKNLKKAAAVYGKDTMKKVMQRESQVIRQEMQRVAPVSKRSHRVTHSGAGTGNSRQVLYHSGNTRNSIQHLSTGKFKNYSSVFIGPKVVKRATAKSYGKGKRTNAWYSRFVEFGTVNQRARPFLEPAYKRTAPIYLARMRSVLSAILKRLNTQ